MKDLTLIESASHGRWTSEEHRLFVDAINEFGREWDKVQAVVKTRSLAQVRSHAQKYFLKLSRSEEIERISETESWKSDDKTSFEELNAVMVLDLMGKVLKKMKSKRDELVCLSETSSYQDSNESLNADY